MLRMPEIIKISNTEQKDEHNDDLTSWVLGVDRRLILIDSMKKHTILKASSIAQETNRSTQNISHALKEFNDKGFIKCLTPEKSTWKRYVLTDLGKEFLSNLDREFM